MARIGIRREDKSHWEGRTPLVPPDIAALISKSGLEFTVQTSPIRAFDEGDYRTAGALIADELDDCPIIMGVKEIPVEKLAAEKTYVYFAHVIKGQSDNMPALRRLLELGCTLIDYEKITDDAGRRLVFFGRFAGIAGMIDTLWALGRRLEHEGITPNPFAVVEPSHRYKDLAAARACLRGVADQIRTVGLPDELQPFACAFAGYGQVSQGAQEIYDLLPVEEVAPAELASLSPSPHTCYKAVFHEQHLVERLDGSQPFELQEYYDHPELYTDAFFPHAVHLTLLVNCIYWEPKYPRLLSREQLASLYAAGDAEPGTPRLRVIGDISCDIDGSVACTVRTTTPDDPIYVYDPATGEARYGVEGRGPVVLAVDFLPSELPVDASQHFSQAMLPFVPGLAGMDASAPFDQAGLPAELARATIVYRGELTESYRYLERYLD